MKIIKNQLGLYNDLKAKTKSKQHPRILRALLTHPRGLTTLDIIRFGKSVSPLRRLTDLRNMGFRITKGERAGNGLFYYRWVL
jgi:hypothetical protein